VAWTYADWISNTGQTRLDRLRLHVQEVSQVMTAATSADGVSYNPATLVPYLEGLRRDEKMLSEQIHGMPMFLPTRRRF